MLSRLPEDGGETSLLNAGVLSPNDSHTSVHSHCCGGVRSSSNPRNERGDTPDTIRYNTILHHIGDIQ
jgi:hypothetical protein